jgi:hypothetical protein
MDRNTDSEEVIRLKLKLAEAQAKITQLEQNSQPQSRTGSVNLEDAGNPQSIAPVAVGRVASWIQDDSLRNIGEGVAGTVDSVPSRGMAFPSKVAFVRPAMTANGSDISNGGNWHSQHQGFNPGLMDPNTSYNVADGYRSDRLTPDSDMLSRPTGGQRGNRYDRFPTPASFHAYGGGYQGNGPFDRMASRHGGNGMGPGPQGMTLNMYGDYASQQMSTSLSPYATEFTSNPGWKTEVCSPSNGDAKRIGY